MNIEEKTVWIAGASAGIGAALARALSRQGAHLVLSARNRDRLEAVRRSCERPDDHTVIVLDVTETGRIPDVVDEVLATRGHIDVLVYNAGISQRAFAVDTGLDVDRTVMEVNYFGAVALTKAVVPRMIARGAGNVVVISSLVGKFGTPRRSAYAASKHALHGFMESLRAECYDAGIRVTMVCPGFVRTEISMHALTGDGSPHGKVDRRQERGMDPDACADRIVSAMRREKAEVLIGGPEKYLVYANRLFPGLVRRFLRGADVT